MYHHFVQHHFYQQSLITPEWITASVTLIGACLALYEFYFRRRPYLKVEIETTQEVDRVVFRAKIVNFGKVPALFNVKKEDIRIKIGDEDYPADADVQGYAFPNEIQTPQILIGHINQIGLNKLLAKEYKDNEARLEITLNYQSYRSKFIKYKFVSKYKIVFTKDSSGGVAYSVLIITQHFR